ncbi:MAG: efflux RND transporter periplasmic adaptor subunit [Verrucomicrobia bacterium]|nr:efflux RND transporter periplasmic adaptor subunit [Verrucomicrobiota bacterium]
MKRILRRIGLIIPTLAAFGILAGCGGHPEHQPESTTLETATVQAQTVHRVNRTATEEIVGTVAPELSAQVSAKVSGTVSMMDAIPGKHVEDGDLLVRIEAREIQARYEQAQAVLERAVSDADRFEKLLNDNVITQQEFDAVKERERVARASLEEAQAMLSYTKVNAPFSGVITVKYVDVGDMAVPGKSLFEMEDPTNLRLEVHVPETFGGKLELNRKLDVSIPAINASMQGVISEISPSSDPRSRTFLVKLDLPQIEGLRSGHFGRVKLPLAEVAAIRVPSSAVITKGQMETVFVVENEHAEMRLVKTGKNFDGEVEVVAGLNEGEQIIVSGNEHLKDGQPVRIKS